MSLRRSALAAALHADAEWGAIASGFDRGLSAYCWPREAIWVGGALERLGHPAIGRAVYHWLNKVRHRHRPFLYWFQKYSIDGVPEWETPAVDQTALIPWGLERHYRRTGDLDLVAAVWPMIEQAAAVCCGDSGGHPGLRMLEDLNLISSAGERRPALRGLPLLERVRRGGPPRRRAAGRRAGARANRRGDGPPAPIGSGTTASSRSSSPAVRTSPGWSIPSPAASSRPAGSPSSGGSGPTIPSS